MELQTILMGAPWIKDKTHYSFRQPDQLNPGKKVIRCKDMWTMDTILDEIVKNNQARNQIWATYLLWTTVHPTLHLVCGVLNFFLIHKKEISIVSTFQKRNLSFSLVKAIKNEFHITYLTCYTINHRMEQNSDVKNTHFHMSAPELSISVIKFFKIYARNRSNYVR